jgi:hypothetical protein
MVGFAEHGAPGVWVKCKSPARCRAFYFCLQFNCSRLSITGDLSIFNFLLFLFVGVTGDLGVLGG